MPEPTSADATLLAFDFGIKRIGVAVGVQRLGLARALQTLQAEDNAARFSEISKLIDNWQPERLVVGLPLNDDGTPHAMTARAERFANQLRGRFGLTVDTVDERFSSLEADANLRQSPSRQRRLSWQERKQQVDAEAARIILQSWMDTHA